YFIKETEKFKLKLESVEKEKNELYVKDKEVQKKFEKEKSELQEMLVLEKSAKENLLKEILNLKDKLTKLEELKNLNYNLKEAKQEELLELLEKLKLEELKTKDLIASYELKLKKELEKLEQEKLKKINVLKESEILRNKLVLFTKLEKELIDLRRVKAINNQEKEMLSKQKDLLSEELKNLNQKLIKSEDLRKKLEVKNLEDLRIKDKLLKETTELDKKLKIELDKQKNEIQMSQSKLNSLIINEEQVKMEEWNIKSYKKDDLYKLYEIAKELKVKEDIVKELFVLWRYKATNLKISDSQYGVILKNYFELHEAITKFEMKKYGVNNTKMNLKKESSIVDLLNKVEKELLYLREVRTKDNQEKERLAKERDLLIQEIQSFNSKLKEVKLSMTEEIKELSDKLKVEELKVKDLTSSYELELKKKLEKLELEKSAKENLSKEIVNLKDKITKLEELEEMKAKLIKIENFKLQNNSEEIKVNKNLENNKNEINQNIEEKEIQILESKKYGDWFNIENYRLNKSNLSLIISNFCLDDFKEIYSESQKRNLLSQSEKIQILNIITSLKFNTPLSSLNMEKIEDIYIKIMDHLIKEESKVKIEINEPKNIMDEKVESVREIEAKELKNNWADKEKFLQNKNDLVGLLKTFEAKDFMEMYLEGKKRGLLKSLKDKDFTNIMTRLKLKLPLSDVILEKLENFYEDLMSSVYSQEFLLIEENLESNKDDEKDINLENENEFEQKEFDIESYTAKDWYRVYDLAKEYRVKDWLQKSIFIIARLKDAKSEISDSHYATIRRNYSELYQIIEKIEAEKNFNQTIKLDYSTEKIKVDIKKFSSEDWYQLFKNFESTSKDEEIFKKYLLSLAKYKEKNLNLTNSQIIVIENNYEIIQSLIEKQASKKLITPKQNLNLEQENLINYKEVEKKNENLKIEIELDKNIADILF
ncbi:MAG: hypothetical protein ACRCZO_15735, partial [Cetobacterium sp.]